MSPEYEARDVRAYFPLLGGELFIYLIGAGLRPAAATGTAAFVVTTRIVGLGVLVSGSLLSTFL